MPIPEPERTLFSWEAPVRPYRSPNKQTLTTAGVIAGLIAVILLFAGEWMLIATIGALIFAYYLWSTVPSQNTAHSITTWGIRTNDQLYRWEEMTRFWFDIQWGHELLVLEMPTKFPPQLNLLLHKASSKEVETLLAPYLLKEKPAPTPLDKAGSWLASKFPLE